MQGVQASSHYVLLRLQETFVYCITGADRVPEARRSNPGDPLRCSQGGSVYLKRTWRLIRMRIKFNVLCGHKLGIESDKSITAWTYRILRGPRKLIKSPKATTAKRRKNLGSLER